MITWPKELNVSSAQANESRQISLLVESEQIADSAQSLNSDLSGCELNGEKHMFFHWQFFFRSPLAKLCLNWIKFLLFIQRSKLLQCYTLFDDDGDDGLQESIVFGRCDFITSKGRQRKCEEKVSSNYSFSFSRLTFIHAYR